jgi:ribonuclease P protein component
MIPKKNRLTKAFFRETHARPTLLRGGHLALSRYFDEMFTHPRIAVVVSKKINKSAVGRNRIKRRILAILKELITQIPIREALVFRVHSKLEQISYDELRAEITQLLSKKSP